MKQEIVPYALLQSNSWNPNVMNSRQFEAELQSIAEFGFIDPPTVREPEGVEYLEIVDGEHRWKAYDALYQLWQSGSNHYETEDGRTIPFHPMLKEVFADHLIPVVNLGQISETTAKRLTLIMNETRGKANPVDVAALLAQIAEESDVATARQGLPHTAAEMEELLQLAAFDWDAVAKTTPEQAPEETDTEQFVTINVRLSESQHSVYLAARDRIASKLAEEGQNLHESEAISHGQVLELLSAEYLASP
jgi:hypothetical protein